MHPASAHEAALKTPSAGDTLGAFPLGRVLVKTDILVLGKLRRIRDGDDDGGTVLLNVMKYSPQRLQRAS